MSATIVGRDGQSRCPWCGAVSEFSTITIPNENRDIFNLLENKSVPVFRFSSPLQFSSPKVEITTVSLGITIPPF